MPVSISAAWLLLTVAHQSARGQWVPSPPTNTYILQAAIPNPTPCNPTVTISVYCSVDANGHEFNEPTLGHPSYMWVTNWVLGGESWTQDSLGVFTNGGVNSSCTLSNNPITEWSVTLTKNPLANRGPVALLGYGVVNQQALGGPYMLWPVLLSITFDMPGPNDGCDSGTCAGSPAAAFGSASPENSQGPDIQFSLGAFSFGQTAGLLELNANTAVTPLSSPATLTVASAPLATGQGMDVVTNSAGEIAQVDGPQGLVTVATNRVTNGYQLQFFHATNVTAKTGGFYGTNGAPFDIWTVQSPGGNPNALVLSESASGNQTTYAYTTNNDLAMWRMTDGDGLRTVWSWVAGTNWAAQSGFTASNYVRQICAGTSTNIVQQIQKTYGVSSASPFPLLLQEIDGTGASTNVTTCYYSGIQVQQVNYPDGSWEVNEWDGTLLQAKYSSLGNATPLPLNGNPTTVAHQLTTYSYSPVVTGDDPANQPSLARLETTYQTDSSLTEQQISVLYRSAPQGNEVDEYRCPQPAANWSDAGNLETRTSYCANSQDPNLSRQVQWRLLPDGTGSLYAYNEDTNGVLTNIVAQTGRPNDPANFTNIVHGTQTITAFNPLGKVLSRTTQDITNGIAGALLAQSTCTYSDPLDLSYSVVDLANRTNTFVYSSCGCGMESITDPDGVIISYAYDDLLRPYARTVTRGTASLTTTSTLDAAGRTLVVGIQGA